MMKLRIILASRMPLYLILGGLISMHACKNKKQLTEISDTEEVKAQIEQELGQEQEQKTPERVTTQLQTSQVTRKPLSGKELTRSQQVNQHFEQVATAQDYATANKAIDEAMSQFSGPDATVLIIVYQNGSEVEYDEPTTIARYLHYLKDTHSKPALVEEMVTDESGKIKELVLRKN